MRANIEIGDYQVTVECTPQELIELLKMQKAESKTTFNKAVEQALEVNREIRKAKKINSENMHGPGQWLKFGKVFGKWSADEDYIIVSYLKGNPNNLNGLYKALPQRPKHSIKVRAEKIFKTQLRKYKEEDPYDKRL